MNESVFLTFEGERVKLGVPRRYLSGLEGALGMSAYQLLARFTSGGWNVAELREIIAFAWHYGSDAPAPIGQRFIDMAGAAGIRFTGAAVQVGDDAYAFADRVIASGPALFVRTAIAILGAALLGVDEADAEIVPLEDAA